MNDWRPSAPAEAARRRARLLDRARQYFSRHEVLAVDTPVLGRATVTDPNIDSLQCDDGRFLQTSPEYFMKRLLAAGYPDIYSIGPVFRRNEHGSRHLSQFTMVEWYRLGFGLDAIVRDAIALIATLLRREGVDAERHDYATLFEERLGIDPLVASLRELQRAAGADAELIDTMGERRDAWLDLLMATRIAATLPADRLSVVQHYPASQAALARRCPHDPRVADRFEVFCGTMELANGYVELTDPVEQAERMRADAAARRASGKAEVDPDQRLLHALEAGLPACAGVALGLERVQMIADGSGNIRDVVTFVEERDDDRL